MNMRVVMMVVVMLAACATEAEDVGLGVETSELSKSCPQGADVTYVSHNKRVCSTVLFACDAGMVPFNNKCGCGCELPACPDPTDPNVTYISQDEAQCSLIRFSCAEGTTAFFGVCGCGCIGSL